MYYFLGTCVQINGEMISKMVDEATEVDYEYLTKYIHQKELRLLFPGYDWETQGGLQLHNDHYVKFYKSKFNGHKCLFIDHSAIEYVWIKGE